MSLHPDVQLAYAAAGVKSSTLGIEVEHHQAADGTWRATIDLDDLLTLAAVVSAPRDPSSGRPR
ncbi:MAG: hypothetical protein ACEQSX_02715 [Baekduiaceae bacterium]